MDNGQLKIVPIVSLCFEYRMDVLFRAYVLDTYDLFGWGVFNSIPINRPKANFKLLFDFRDSIREIGQQVPVNVVRVKGKLYPTMGNKRTACLISLGSNFIIANEVSIKSSPKWNVIRNLDSNYMAPLPDDIKGRFASWLNDHTYLDTGNQSWEDWEC